MIGNKEIRELGYSKELDILQDKLHEIHEKRIHSQALSFAMLGCSVNYSFYERLNKTEFTKEEVIEAVHQLNRDALNRGVTNKDFNFDRIKGREWYQLWKNDWDEKLINCFKFLKEQYNW